MWKTLADLGLLGILVPKTYGGVGLGYVAAAVVAGELGKALLTEPFCAVGVLAVHVLVDSGRDGVARDLLGGLVSGEVVPVVAWQENEFGIGSENVSTTFEPNIAGGSLNGRKEFVVGGLDATGFIVLARSKDGVGLYWAPRGSAGIKLEPYATADGGRHAAVTFEGVQVAKNGVLAGPGRGLSVLQRGLDVALIVTSAELCGVASKLFELTLRFVGQRQQFGRLIGSFQSVQHRASDSAMFLKITEAVIIAATAALGAGSAKQVSAMASRVKARSSSTALQIAKDAVQLHGAMGFTQECDVSLYLNRILVLSNWLGGSSMHRRRYAALHAQGPALRKAPTT